MRVNPATHTGTPCSHTRPPHEMYGPLSFGNFASSHAGLCLLASCWLAGCLPPCWCVIQAPPGAMVVSKAVHKEGST